MTGKSVELNITFGYAWPSTALVSVIVQSARLDMLATMRAILEAKDAGPGDK